MYRKYILIAQGGNVRKGQKYMLLPVSCRQENQLRSSLPGEVSPLFQQHLITVIDDSPTVRKILEVCLRREGYQVRSFQDGIELLSWLMLLEARIPPVMVVDVNLPKMDGYTLIRHLKAKPVFAQTAFVILTGRAGMLDRLKGRLSGAQVYLTKPFRTDEVLAAVRSCLGPLHAEQTAEGMREVASR